MAGKSKSLVGQRFGRWIVIGEPITIKKRSHSLWCYNKLLDTDVSFSIKY